MTLRTRRIVFYSLIGVFFIIAPFVIFSSVGYSINLKQWRLESTGGIFIKSKTPRLSVFLDNEFIKETGFLSGSALITDLSPEAHITRLEKTGYRPWSKNLLINPTTVTEIRNVILLPAALEAATSTPDEIKAIEAYEALVAPIPPPLASAAKDAKKKPPVPVGDFFLNPKGDLVLNTGTTTQTIAKDIYSFQKTKNRVFFITKSAFLASFDPATKEIRTLGRPGFYFSDKPMRFVLSQTDDLAIIDPSGGLFLLTANNDLKAVTGGALDARFDSGSQKLLIAKADAIEVLWLEDNQYQPFQKEGVKESLPLPNEEIVSAQWFFGDDSHIIIRTKEELLFTELDGRGGRNTTSMYLGRTDALATLPDFPGTIFFKKGKTWFKIEL